MSVTTGCFNGLDGAPQSFITDYPVPETGSPTSYNPLGQDVLDDLLTSPQTAFRSYVHSSYGPVTEYLLPDTGARFGSTGNLMGFL